MNLKQKLEFFFLKAFLWQVQELTYLLLSKVNVILFVPFLSLLFDYGKQPEVPAFLPSI